MEKETPAGRVRPGSEDFPEESLESVPKDYFFRARFFAAFFFAFFLAAIAGFPSG